MRKNAEYPSLIYPDNLSEIMPIRRPSGRLVLTDQFKMASYSAAIFDSPELSSIAAGFDYERHGYDVLLRGPGMDERGPIAQITDGKVSKLRQASYKINKDKIDIAPLESDLHPYAAPWTDLFNSFAKQIIPCFGPTFEIRLKILQYDQEWFHKDSDVIAILPLGKGRRSTVLQFEKTDPETGEVKNEKIYSDAGELVFTTPEQEHSSPISTIPRACIAAIKYSCNF